MNTTADGLAAALWEAYDRRRVLTPLLPHQIPPTGKWDGWLLTGGRGTGKTYAGARWLGDKAAGIPGLRGRIIAPTLSDAVNSVVNDPDSGILRDHPEAVLKTTGPEGVRLVWPNGSVVWCVGTAAPRDVDRLRALTNIDADLFEEAAANPHLEAAVYQAGLSRRGKRLRKPLWVATTTPRATPTIKRWIAGRGTGIEYVAVTRASTLDNPYTPDAYRQRVEALRGTRLYRQEVLGEIIDDVEGALWKLVDLERSTYAGDRADLLDHLGRCIVGVDPPSGSGTCGIVVVGRHRDTGHLYVLDDYSVTDASPNQWAKRVSQAATDYQAGVVAEVNQGGRMVTEVLRNVDPGLPVSTVHAAVGKQTRAEPIAVYWEADEQVAHLAPGTPGALDSLVDQLTGWVPGDYSPDRLDAMVWACTYLRRPDTAVLHLVRPTRNDDPPTTLAAMRGGRA